MAITRRSRFCEHHEGDTYRDGCWGCERLVEIEEGNIEIQRLRRALRAGTDEPCMWCRMTTASLRRATGDPEAVSACVEHGDWTERVAQPVDVAGFDAYLDEHFGPLGDG